VDRDYDELFRDAGGPLWRALYAYSGGRKDIADDALAEAFARAMERDGQIRAPVPWLYRTAFRIAAHDLRRARSIGELEDLPGPETPPDAVEVVQALKRLSPGQRGAVYLHYQVGMPVREVSRILGTSAAVVKVHLHRGRKRLRELLGDQEET
jgi:RNA polymerase sigma-70 factor (ECF subfamily)